MKSVRIDRAELLRKLRSNRDAHIQDYHKALEGFRHKYLIRLHEMTDRAQGGEFDLHVGLQEPRNYANSYDIEIAMLEMSQDEIIELDVAEFRRFVLDDWEWAESFKNMVTSYAITKG